MFSPWKMRALALVLALSLPAFAAEEPPAEEPPAEEPELEFVTVDPFAEQSFDERVTALQDRGLEMIYASEGGWDAFEAALAAFDELYTPDEQAEMNENPEFAHETAEQGLDENGVMLEAAQLQEQYDSLMQERAPDQWELRTQLAPNVWVEYWSNGVRWSDNYYFNYPKCDEDVVEFEVLTPSVGESYYVIHDDQYDNALRYAQAVHEAAVRSDQGKDAVRASNESILQDRINQVQCGACKKVVTPVVTIYLDLIIDPMATARGSHKAQVKLPVQTTSVVACKSSS